MFERISDRRFSRHGSNIITGEERRGTNSAVRQSAAYQTAVVVDFISNPVAYLSEKIEAVITSTEVSESQVSGFAGRVKEKIDKIKKFNIKNEDAEPGSEGSLQEVKSMTRLEAMTNPLSNKIVDNPELVNIVPRNSIVAINITDLSNPDRSMPEIFFPFFPAHFSLPVKPGEHVWIFYENIGGKRVGYWMFRKSASLPVDDLNYTHADREASVTAALNVISSKKNSLKKKEIVENLFLGFPNAAATSNEDSRTLEGKDDYDKIIKESKSYNEEFIGEPVPKYYKKCSDLVLQGSNNTLVVLGHDGNLETGCIKLIAGRSVSQGQVLKNSRPEARQYEYEELSSYGDMLTSEQFLQGIPQTINEVDVVSQQFSKAEVVISQTGRISFKADNEIVANASGASFLRMTPGDLSLSRTSNFDYSNSQITLIDGQLGIEARDVVSVRASGGEIKLAYTGDTANPTTKAEILMNDGDEPYVIHSALEEVLDILLADVQKNNMIIDLIVETMVATMNAAVIGSGDAFKNTIDLTLSAAGGSFDSLLTTDELIRITQSPDGPMTKLKSKSIFGSE